MAYKRTGRSGANTGGCKASFSDMHNERKTRNIPCNPNTSIRPELTKYNSVWIAPDVPSLVKLDHDIRKDYASVWRESKSKDGTIRRYQREMPSKGKTAATPLKETILNLPSNGQETDAMVEEFSRRVEELTGWRCVRRFVHRDERYDNPDTGEQHFNCHAHLVWDCYDWQKHQIRSFGKETMRKIQDIASEVTGMERGIDARITNAEHLSVAEFKNKEERQRAEDLKAQNLALQQEVAGLRTEVKLNLAELAHALHTAGHNIVAQFDHITRFTAARDYERETRDKLEQEIKKNLVNEAENEKALRQHVATLQLLVANGAAVIQELTKRTIKAAAAAKRSLAAALAKTKALKFLVPSAQLKEVATVEFMQSQLESAMKCKDNAIDRELKAISDKKDAEEALATAREDAARPWREKCQKLQKEVDTFPQQLHDALQEGINEGAKALIYETREFKQKIQKLEKQLETSYTYNAQLERKVQALQQQNNFKGLKR